jgi:hypothetical protein
MKKIIIFFSLIIFLGCSNPIPQWYFKHQNDNKEYIYAAAQGNTKQEAINNALSFIASKLQVNISSKFESTKGLYQYGNNKTYFQKIKKTVIAKIQNISFINYKILKLKKIDDKFYVLISINRYKNAHNIEEKAKNNLNTIKPYLKIKDKIKILKIYPKILRKISSIISNLYIAQTLYPTQETKKLIKKAVLLKNAFKNKLDSITFHIQNSKYSNVIREVFNRLNLSTSNQGINVIIHSKTQKSKAAGYYIVTIYLNLIFKDKTNYTLSLICAGTSMSNFNIAKQFALQNCKEKLKEKLKTFLKTHY